MPIQKCAYKNTIQEEVTGLYEKVTKYMKCLRSEVQEVVDI